MDKCEKILFFKVLKVFLCIRLGVNKCEKIQFF